MAVIIRITEPPPSKIMLLFNSLRRHRFHRHLVALVVDAVLVLNVNTFSALVKVRSVILGPVGTTVVTGRWYSQSITRVASAR